MKKARLLKSLLGLATLSSVALPLTSCKGEVKKNQIEFDISNTEMEVTEQQQTTIESDIFINLVKSDDHDIHQFVTKLGLADLQSYEIESSDEDVKNALQLVCDSQTKKIHIKFNGNLWKNTYYFKINVKYVDTLFDKTGQTVLSVTSPEITLNVKKNSEINLELSVKTTELNGGQLDEGSSVNNFLSASFFGNEVSILDLSDISLVESAESQHELADSIVFDQNNNCIKWGKYLEGGSYKFRIGASYEFSGQTWNSYSDYIELKISALKVVPGVNFDNAWHPKKYDSKNYSTYQIDSNMYIADEDGNHIIDKNTTPTFNYANVSVTGCGNRPSGDPSNFTAYISENKINWQFEIVNQTPPWSDYSRNITISYKINDDFTVVSNFIWKAHIDL